MKKIKIYTDGACSGNPGPGGYGAVLIYGKKEKEISGFEKHTTNNRMEITACIKALQCVKEPCEITIYSDSAYLFNAFDKKWIDNWVKNNWLKSDKKPVENIDLWKTLLSLTEKHNVSFKKVKGHSTDELNNRCDKLATDEIKKHCKKNVDTDQ